MVSRGKGKLRGHMIIVFKSLTGSHKEERSDLICLAPRKRTRNNGGKLERRKLRLDVGKKQIQIGAVQKQNESPWKMADCPSLEASNESWNDLVRLMMLKGFLLDQITLEVPSNKAL